jgi:DNA mismatch endonuclease (patch repair protein)
LQDGASRRGQTWNREGGVVVMPRRSDPLSPEERSSLMSKVRGKGNRSTEKIVADQLIEWGIAGWECHSSGIPGKPDFYFPAERVAIFVDGCFWHGCPHCRRRTPSNRREFWRKKITENRLRDGRTTRALRGSGIHVTRVWEHALRGPRWKLSLRRFLTMCGFPAIQSIGGGGLRSSDSILS